MELSDNIKYISFLLLCIPLRILIAYICYLHRDKRNLWTHALSFCIALASLGFLFLYMQIITRDYGWEAPQKKIYWHSLRPIVATLYICYIVCYLLKIRNGWVFMAAEPVIGLSYSIANKLK